jgi:hypothetical protein
MLIATDPMLVYDRLFSVYYARKIDRRMPTLKTTHCDRSQPPKLLNFTDPNDLKNLIEKPGISILIAGFKVITLFLSDDFQLSQT